MMMSWEEYLVRMEAHSLKVKDENYLLHASAWLNEREAGAVDGRSNKYIYRSFKDFYKDADSPEKEQVFERLREVARRRQEYMKGGK
ncbi:hypothetical protein HMPREF9706_00649 [Facklamia hominis CCUG 36813]|uniref:Uncharacterized protein n=2 Tax=Facklamia hominis TaxID=178214 RepID=K1MEH2_9LACT|nr:hypothetical protein HMPREF9706_00649 [Facklamia hominis CCUG 36813]